MRETECNAVPRKGFSRKSGHNLGVAANLQSTRQSLRRRGPWLGAVAGKRPSHCELWGSKNGKADQAPQV